MVEGVQPGDRKFFLPFGSVEALEQEVFYLMEVWGLPYRTIMEMPVTRRYRLITKKSDLEKKRRAEHDAAVARARSRARMRR